MMGTSSSTSMSQQKTHLDDIYIPLYSTLNFNVFILPCLNIKMQKKHDRKRHEHDIVFAPINPRHERRHDDDHHHYHDYQHRVLPCHEPHYYQNQNWMTRFYFTIQDISASYPVYPTLQHMETMQNFIMALPHIVPCHTSLCKSYITTYIERARDNLDAITSNRNYLIDFLRDFHNDIKQKFGHELYEDCLYHGLL